MVLLEDGPPVSSENMTAGGFFYDLVLSPSIPKIIRNELESFNRSVSGSFSLGAIEEYGNFLLNTDGGIEQLMESNDAFHVNDLDLDAIRVLSKENTLTKAPFQRVTVSRGLAAALFCYNPIKVAQIKKIPAGETVSLYRCRDFIDLCRGPHVFHTGQLQAIKLLQTSSANLSIKSTKSEGGIRASRVRGIAFPKSSQLQEWEKLQELASLRDHRVIGRQQGLFMMSPLSPGSAFMLPHGTRIANRLLDFIRREYRRFGYDEVVTPLLYNKEVWETSGHWDNYREDMYLIADTASNSDDDAHIFCTSEQILGEIRSALAFIDRVYKALGFETYTLALSTRPDRYIGNLDQWNQAESALKEALAETGRPTALKPGDGAFYGPKIDIMVSDALGPKSKGHSQGETTALAVDTELFTGPQMPLDLLIRTSGEVRLSDFLLWQGSERCHIHYVNAFWPDFSLWDAFPALFSYQAHYYLRFKQPGG
ncbi:54S ribosomal protein L39, mitochondrial [Phlyctochytrium bullatum]|nr:54S ribosomal protein L39, mitochondrial [Phlyctochytrium bullatum]